MKRLLSAVLAVSIFLPVTALALEGIGPRKSVSGIVREVNISAQQKFDEEGGEFVIEATNGQRVTVITTKDTKIIGEGRLSRKSLLPENVTVGMNIRVRGWVIDSTSLTASLLIILNLELNPSFSGNGVIQSIADGSVTFLGPDGQSRTLKVTNESEVNINTTINGPLGLSLVGMQATYTLNSTDPSLIRILRITGLPNAVRTLKPPSSR